MAGHWAFGCSTRFTAESEKSIRSAVGTFGFLKKTSKPKSRNRKARRMLVTCKIQQPTNTIQPITDPIFQASWGQISARKRASRFFNTSAPFTGLPSAPSTCGPPLPLPLGLPGLLPPLWLGLPLRRERLKLASLRTPRQKSSCSTLAASIWQPRSNLAGSAPRRYRGYLWISAKPWDANRQKEENSSEKCFCTHNNKRDKKGLH